ncbi:hypothetical protein FB45DRAFT_892592 [Roridomyces roridus]|uniref:Uncharacterized protein n=1 Tax=Roridomyces roridus TaxID=1738132 RepID=A0AAD7FZY5_9AGAR|nr:hypothetical protein FB45DRAFT_892592 [Roridomyces roridus]
MHNLMHLFDSQQNPVPDHVVRHLQRQHPNSSQNELQQYFSSLESGIMGVSGESAVAYFEQEIQILNMPPRQLYALQAKRPDHVYEEEIKTYPVGQFIVFYHPTHLVHRVDANTRHSFSWSFYLARTEDKATIIEYPHWPAKGIRVEILLTGGWISCSQGMAVPNALVRIRQIGHETVEMAFPPDPTLSEIGVVVLPQNEPIKI